MTYSHRARTVTTYTLPANYLPGLPERPLDRLEVLAMDEHLANATLARAGAAGGLEEDDYNAIAAEWSCAWRALWDEATSTAGQSWTRAELLDQVCSFVRLFGDRIHVGTRTVTAR